jgi:hypothetical protein
LPELTRWADGWLAAKRAEGVASGTPKGYHDHVEAFIAYCAQHGVNIIAALDATIIREWGDTVIPNCDSIGHRRTEAPLARPNSTKTAGHAGGFCFPP